MKINPDHIEVFAHIVSQDLVSQINRHVEASVHTRSQISEFMEVTKARVSQILNSPGNMTIRTMVRVVRVLGLKVTVLVYEDTSIEGPLDPAVFLACWEKCGKPTDWSDVK